MGERGSLLKENIEQNKWGKVCELHLWMAGFPINRREYIVSITGMMDSRILGTIIGKLPEFGSRITTKWIHAHQFC